MSQSGHHASPSDETNATTSRTTPILTFHFHSLFDWLARVLSRPDLEQYLEAYKTRSPVSDSQQEMSDIWDSPFWWSYADSFMEPEDGALKLAFGIGCDGFNPFFNKIAKQVRRSLLPGIGADKAARLVALQLFTLCFITFLPISVGCQKTCTWSVSFPSTPPPT